MAEHFPLKLEMELQRDNLAKERYLCQVALTPCPSFPCETSSQTGVPYVRLSLQPQRGQ